MQGRLSLSILARVLGALIAVLALSACSDDEAAPAKAAVVTSAATDQRDTSVQSAPETMAKVVRWYEPQQVQRGAVLYARLCASCHGDQAQGTFAWRKQGADGLFPPPPLDGTAHAWHHPLRALGAQIKFGARDGRGNMPGFAAALSDQQVLEVIAWFQSKWSDEVYANWSAMDAKSRQAAR